MKVGISLKMREGGYDRFGENKYEKIKSHGFDCVDFDMCNTENKLYHLSDEDFETYLKLEKEAADKAGIEIYQTHGPWTLPIKDFYEEDRKRRLCEMEKSIRGTRILGSRYWVIHPLMPFGLSDMEKAQETFEINISFFKSLIPVAQRESVTICIENTPFPDYSLASVQSISKLLSEIGNKHFKMCLDTGHIAAFSDQFPGNAIRKFGKDIKVLHIHDNKGKEDEHLYPFKGIIDWQDFSSALKETHFGGNLSLEIVPKESLPTDEFEIESRKLSEIAHRLADMIKEA